jgi:hypothetical protein
MISTGSGNSLPSSGGTNPTHRIAPVGIFGQELVGGGAGAGAGVGTVVGPTGGSVDAQAAIVTSVMSRTTAELNRFMLPLHQLKRSSRRLRVTIAKPLINLAPAPLQR